MSEADLSQLTGRDQPEALLKTSQPPQTAGAQLSVLREGRGWSIEQVADQLKLAPRQVEAIEADNYAALPGMAVTRGFIRAYAKLLKVDATPLLGTTPGAFPAKEIVSPKRTVAEPFVENHNMLGGNGVGKFMKWAIRGAFLLLICTIIAVSEMGWLPFKWESLSTKIEKQLTALPSNVPHTPPTNSPEPVTPVVVTTPALEAAPVIPTEVKPELNGEAPKTEALPGTRSFEPVKPNDISVTPNVTSPAPVLPATVPASPVAPIIAPAPPVQSKDQLVLQMRADSWVDIKQADKTVLSRIVKAGETQTIDVTGPISLTIGNVDGVDVTLRGKTVELKTVAKNNVARLSLK